MPFPPTTITSHLPRRNASFLSSRQPVLGKCYMQSVEAFQTSLTDIQSHHRALACGSECNHGRYLSGQAARGGVGGGHTPGHSVTNLNPSPSHQVDPPLMSRFDGAQDSSKRLSGLGGEARSRAGTLPPRKTRLGFLACGRALGPGLPPALFISSLPSPGFRSLGSSRQSSFFQQTIGPAAVAMWMFESRSRHPAPHPRRHA